jgi:hypothetical protein
MLIRTARGVVLEVGIAEHALCRTFAQQRLLLASVA